MGEPAAYFNWLCAKVRQNHSPNHISLFSLLHDVEFTWDPHVSMDRNRAQDGKELREFYCSAVGIPQDRSWFREPCSIFEMLIAFADRAAFETGRPMKDWFWQFMINLKLEDFHRVSSDDEARIHERLYAFVWRLYDQCGDGGLFPLRKPCRNDQRRVELWYQLFEYLDDQGL